MFIPFAFQGTKADTDAQAYITEVKAQGGTLSLAEETAIDKFYTNLKSAGLYAKLHVFYPFIGEQQVVMLSKVLIQEEHMI